MTPKLQKGRVVTSPTSGIGYRVTDTLGEGGFGVAYLAEELTKRGRVVREVCLKATTDQTSWHRESYFGELMTGNRRVIQTFDSFPLARRSGMLFCLVSELATHGTIADYLEVTAKPWPEKRAVREIKALLKVLDGLHGANATHRDLTPMNVFVCGRGTLKLGDFGIARHELSGKPGAIEAFNPEFVTRGFLESRHRHWLSVDDVFQMGQLLGVLLTGDPDATMTPGLANKLSVKPALRSVLKRAIGPRGKRYADAYEMIQALDGEQPASAPVESPEGLLFCFTGPMSLKRFDAEVMVLQAGGRVTQKMNREVDVLVQGGRSQHYKSGHKGSKLEKAQQLVKQGRPIRIIGEAEFRALVRPEPQS